MIRTTPRPTSAFRSVRAVGLVGTLLLLAGCFWPAPGAGPSRRAHNPFEDQITQATVADLEEVWSAATSGAVSYVVTSDQAVHVSVGKQLHSLDRKTGAGLWGRDNAAYPDWVPMGPANYADGVLWVGYGLIYGGGGYVTELTDPLTGDVLGTPDGVGFVDGVRGDHYLLQRPEFDLDLPDALFIDVGNLAVPDEGWSGLVDVQDSGMWSALTLGTEHVYQAGTGLLPVGMGNGVRAYPIAPRPDCPPDLPAFLVCPTWGAALDGSEATSPVLGPGASTLYTATDAGTVYAIDTSDGTEKWNVPVGAAVLAEPALAHGSLFLPTADGRLVVLDAATGTVLWEAAAGDEPAVQPAVTGELVFTGAQDGSVHAFDAAGCGEAMCEPLWSTSVGAAVTGAPVVSNGMLYIGAEGSLIAYGLPPA